MRKCDRHRAWLSHAIAAGPGAEPRMRCTACKCSFVYDDETCAWFGLPECLVCGRADVMRVLCAACAAKMAPAGADG